MMKVSRRSVLETVGLLCLLAHPCLAQQFVLDWIKTCPADGGLSSRGTAIGLTKDGKIVVGGSLDDENGEPAYLAVAYSGAGDVKWKTAHRSETLKNNVLADVTFDPVGNIFLTGNSDTVKLDAFGNRVWSAPYNGRSVAANARYAYVTSVTSPGYSAIQLGNDVPGPVDVILDCDPGQDPDDLSDLALVNNLMSRGEVNLLAIMGAHKGYGVAVSIDVMRKYYGHPTIPYGIAQSGPAVTESYTWHLAERYGTSVRFDAPLPDAVALYRSILASRPDHSVTIVFGGQLRNLHGLWNSGPDAISPLFGPALLAKKASQLIIVAGFFPDSFGGAEYNLFSDLEAAQVLNSLTENVSVTYVGIELGDAIQIPIKGVSVMDPRNPVRYAHELTRAASRPSWTGMGLLVAARGDSWNGNRYFTSVAGHAFVRADGSNGFVEEENANHRYLRKAQPDERYKEILDDLLLMPPPAAPQTPTGDQTGQEIWTRPFNIRAWDAAKVIRINDLGEVFVGGVESRAGEFETTAGRFALVKYGEAGSVRWRIGSTNLTTPARVDVELKAMAVAGDSIWLFGQYGKGSALFKFSGAGQQLWQHNFPDGSRAAQMEVDANGAAYVANIVANQIAVTSIGSDGSLIREAVHGSDAYEGIDVEAAALDGSGAVYFAGGLKTAEKAEIFLLRFSQDLGESSITTYPSRHTGDARAKAIAIQSSGDVYLTGYLPTAEGGSELFALKLAPAFQMQKVQDGPLRLTYRVAGNETLTLEATHDFSQWEHVATVRADSDGFVRFEDTNVGNLPARFYRTRKE